MMFKFIKSLFKTPKIIDAIINSGDALVFTDEERKNWVIESAKVLGPQTLARRVISIIVTGIWAISTINGLVLTNFVIFSESVTIDGIKPFMELYGYVALVFGGVMAFYYGTSFKRAVSGNKK